MTLLEFLRRSRKTPRTALAHDLRCDSSYLGHLESGRWRPNPESPVVQRLERYFKRPIGELLAEVDLEDLQPAGRSVQGKSKARVPPVPRVLIPASSQRPRRRGALICSCRRRGRVVEVDLAAVAHPIQPEGQRFADPPGSFDLQAPSGLA